MYVTGDSEKDLVSLHLETSKKDCRAVDCGKLRVVGTQLAEGCSLNTML